MGNTKIPHLTLLDYAPYEWKLPLRDRGVVISKMQNNIYTEMGKWAGWGHVHRMADTLLLKIAPVQ